MLSILHGITSAFGSLTNIFAASQDRFCRLPGMGIAKYTQLQAVLEMARRALGEELKTERIPRNGSRFSTAQSGK